MALIVQKFGGTSVGTVDRIENVADRIGKFREHGDDIVVVVSAMSGETNRLVELAHSIDEKPEAREYDVLLSTGEQVTIALLSMALNKRGISARSYTGTQVHILTDSTHNKARILSIEEKKMRTDLDKGRVIVVAGFQGVDEHGNITTLGRGGSDTTAVALAAALKADECQIYTDVDGVYTTDPRVVPEARRLEKITFEEMLEMASLGSKVLQIRAVEFAGKYNVPLRVLSSFDEPAFASADTSDNNADGSGNNADGSDNNADGSDHKADGSNGTLITYEDDEMEQALISGIAFNRDEAKLTILGVPDRPGVAYSILGPIGDSNVEIDMIIQNISADGTTDFTFTVHRNDYVEAKEVLSKVSDELGAREVVGDDKIVKISIVGVGMRSHAGIASKMFKALAEEGINIIMISTSEIKISVVVDEKYLELGVRTLHSAFGLEQKV